jgi:homoserine dehydrogenase
MTVDSFHTSGTSPSFTGRHQPCKVAIAGFGTVGSAVASRLAGPDPVDGLELTHILDRRAALKREVFVDRHSSRAAAISWTTCFDDILTSDVDVVVEAIGGLEPAADWIGAALAAGKSVVTANKQVIAQCGPSLLALAARQGRQLRFEAAVGGAMPIVRAVSDGLAGDRLTRIVGVLNGTSNAVLSRMESTGCSIEQAVIDVRQCGYAEADPSVDLDGIDARAKLAILCSLGFGLRIDPARIDARSIAALGSLDLEQARRRGGKIRQLAFAAYDRRRSELTAWVAPAIVPQWSILARTSGAENAALITGEHAGDIGVCGAGAGGRATAVAVISDLVTIARDRAAIVLAPTLSVPGSIVGLDAGIDIVDYSENAERDLAEAV